MGHFLASCIGYIKRGVDYDLIHSRFSLKSNVLVRIEYIYVSYATSLIFLSKNPGYVDWSTYSRLLVCKMIAVEYTELSRNGFFFLLKYDDLLRRLPLRVTINHRNGIWQCM